MSQVGIKKQVFFGRYKGRKFSAQAHRRIMERLDSLSVQRWRADYPKELWLEIGFGSGEHLCQWLTQHPTRSVIGVEVFLNGLIHCVDAIAPELEPRCSIFSQPIQELWPMLPEGLFDGIILFFPDPWPKRRHQDRRMVQHAFLNQCAKSVKPGGLFYFASDHQPLVAHSLEVFHAHPRWQFLEGASTAQPKGWPQWPENWPSSRYRDKALSLGIPCAFSVWQETSSPMPAVWNPVAIPDSGISRAGDGSLARGQTRG
jgi:tRNA (guanine-N7-)-methyltransferase